MPYLANKTEKSLENLARLLNVTIKFGWKQILADELGFKRNLLSTWINRDTIPKKQLAKIEEKGFPAKYWHDVTPYKQTAEIMGVPEHPDAPDSDPGSYGVPDLNGYRVTRVISPSDEKFIKMLTEVLISEEKGTIEALKSNIRQFHEQVKEKKRLKVLEREIKELKTILKEQGEDADKKSIRHTKKGNHGNKQQKNQAIEDVPDLWDGGACR